MTETAALKVNRWIERNTLNLVCVRDKGEDCNRDDRPAVLVVAQGEFHPWARGLVWDFRLAPDKCAMLLDYNAPLLQPSLNADYFARQLAHHPNQQLLSMIADGVRYQADVELQGVFIPHLVSLPKGYASVQKELRRLGKMGWCEFYPHLSF